MKIEAIAVGGYQANCYLVYDELKKVAILVDPGSEANKIIDFIQKSGVKVAAIVNTHGHVDHISANDAVSKYTGVGVAIHQDDAAMLGDPSLNLSMFTGENTSQTGEVSTLSDGDVIEVDGVSLKVLHTPGHTTGGICLLGDGYILTGDTLFQGSVGRSDFPGGSHNQLIKSIKDKLMILPDQTVVYPGHGPSSSIGYESHHNPFLS
jgi:glyoxylase-like metal-dependent hydrolase (beta-lactamase superfamily II)